jgi:transketolase
MRTAFIESLLEEARRDKRVMLLTGDLGFGVVIDFMKELPQQFLNAGVAEQNMTGMAAGLAMSGKIVFTYSIANFPVLRCYEQIRNDVCYHNANVKIVSVGGGMAYGSLGISHHAVEDIAVMRALPNMMVVAPNDPVETRLATKAVIAHNGPCYLRLGRAGEPVVHANSIEYNLGKAIQVRHGWGITLIATGGLLGNALAAADMLAEEGIDARVLSMHTVKPLDEQAIMQAAEETYALFTVEEHSVVGGLGGSVAETLLEKSDRKVKFKRIGIENTFTSTVGDQDYLRAVYGLDAQGIARVVRETLSAGTAAKPLHLFHPVQVAEKL